MTASPIRFMAGFLLSSSLVFMACSGDDPSTDVKDASADVAVEVPADDADTIPCAPRAVLQAVCQQCHTSPPQSGAPFPLVTRSNIVRVGSDGREIRTSMIEQLEAGRMPLAPATIDAPSKAVLLEWLQAGAPAVASQQCTDAGSPGADSGAAPDASDARATLPAGDAAAPTADAAPPEVADAAARN